MASDNGVPTRPLGTTGVDVSMLCLGGFHIGVPPEEEGIRLIHTAIDSGLTFMDNAWEYNNNESERRMGVALAQGGYREKAFLMTKNCAHDRTAKNSMVKLEESLRRLQTDYLDLWQIHEVTFHDDPERIFAPGGAGEAMLRAKEQGKVRFIGFTGHRDPAVLAEMMKRYKTFDTILMPLHIADSGYLSFERGALREANKLELGVQAMKTTANAKLLQSFSIGECLRYALSLRVHTAALGCTTIGQLEDDVRIAKAFTPLNDTVMAAMRQRADRIKGPDLEDWKRNTERASLYVYAGG